MFNEAAALNEHNEILNSLRLLKQQYIKEAITCAKNLGEPDNCPAIEELKISSSEDEKTEKPT
jgi:hypothetical protein